MDGITLSCLVGELQALQGSVVRRVYHPRPELITLSLWSPRAKEEQTLLIGAGEPPRFHLTGARLENPLSPSNFCMLLRKHLKGGVLVRLAQHGMDRIVALDFRRADGPRRLIAELFGRRGNLVLVLCRPQPEADAPQDAEAITGQGRILGALKASPSHSQGKRSLRAGGLYALEPQGRLDLDLLDLDEPDEPDEPEAPSRTSPLSLSRALFERLRDFGLGARLAQELALRAGLDPQGPFSGLNDEERARLRRQIQDLYDRVRRGDFSPGVFFDDHDNPIDAAPFPLRLYEGERLRFRAYRSMSEALDACFRAQFPAAQEDVQRARLLKAVRARLKKTQTALDRVAQDLEGARRFSAVKRRADLILTNLSRLKRGDSQAELSDPQTGEVLSVKLDPRLSPTENAQKYYARYKKLKRGVEKLEARRRQLRAELEYFMAQETQVEQAEGPDELAELEEELGLSPPPGARRRDRELRRGPRRYRFEGYTVLVGHSGRQNDELVRRAHGEDLWLHARERPGSHVLIRTGGRPEGVPEEVRLRAAELAAYYSKGRGSTKVPVTITRAKYLRKGAKPGLVLLTREEATLLVRPRDHGQYQDQDQKREGEGTSDPDEDETV